MKMIWAVVRSDKVDSIARSLQSVGVSGCTTYRVRGYGEEWHLYEPLIHGGHHRLDVIVEEHQLAQAVDKITEQASTGLAGDGILAVFDLASVVSIRSAKSSHF